MERDRVAHIERMRKFIAHRERVLDMQSVVKKQILTRASSAPGLNRRKSQPKETYAERERVKENERLLRSLTTIAYRKPQFNNFTKK
ncbi:unnamed protein product [Caenorhabditis auriculariae]|uniref:Uncharacterized protein n=1 Tax=Caenorhabditis auriculariae TaxID=2777116 RepID=A0A8S1HK53_9PELO|nr:unnamed protein product [Caenorhabditis auriculariae]